MIQIGIDPAFRKNGFAICIIDDDKDVRCIRFESFLDFLSWLWVEGEAPLGAVCVVENSNLTDKLFYTHKTKPGALLTYTQAKRMGRKAIKLSANEIAKISMGVGKNQAISQCVHEATKLKYGKLAFEVSPKEKGAKWGNGNLSFARKVFLATLKSEKHNFLATKKTISQDEIDAYQLALMGKSLMLRRGAKIRL